VAGVMIEAGRMGKEQGGQNSLAAFPKVPKLRWPTKRRAAEARPFGGYHDLGKRVNSPATHVCADDGFR